MSSLPLFLKDALALFSLLVLREITARKISVHTQYKGHLTRSLKKEATASGKAAVKPSAGVWSKGPISALGACCHVEQVWGRGAGGIDHSSREVKDPDLYVDPDFKM